MAASHGLSILITLAVLLQVNSNLVENATGRIINGNNVTTQYRYHAHLLLDRPGDGTRVGSGVVLTRRLILTTGQNIHGFTEYRAGLGNVLREDLIWRTAMMALTSNNFNPETLENNIGFLVFNDTNSLDVGTVTPITLPNIMFGSGLPYQNEQGRVIGFGHTTNGDDFATHLQYAYKRVISTADCQASYPNHNMADSFCAHDTITHGKICGGDQGGAFVTLVNGREYLTGIASYVLETECIPEQPALFVRTLYHRASIETFMMFFN